MLNATVGIHQPGTHDPDPRRRQTLPEPMIPVLRTHFHVVIGKQENFRLRPGSSQIVQARPVERLVDPHGSNATLACCGFQEGARVGLLTAVVDN